MPLTATLDGVRVDSVMSSEDDWLELKRVYKARSLLMSCGLPAFPRTSNLGLRHFVHKRGVKCGQMECWSETPQHRAAKSIIAHAAAGHGWRVAVEHAADDRSWVADVLAEKAGRRVALEVQWSKQGSAEFASRQERYDNAGVECLWFVHRRNRAAAVEAGVPHLVFEGDALLLNVLAHKAFRPDAPIPLAEATIHVLERSFLKRADSVATSAVLETVEMACFACRKMSTVWRIGAVNVRTRCQQEATFERSYYGDLWSLERLEALLYDDIRATVPAMPLAPLRVHYSNTTRSAYLAYGCAHCSRGFFGDYFIANAYDWDSAVIPVEASLPLSEDMQSDWHVCVDDESGRCSQIQSWHEGPVFDGTAARPRLPEIGDPDPDSETGDEVISEPTELDAVGQMAEAVQLPPARNLLGDDAEPTRLWRRYRALVRVAAGGHHFSDDIHTRIASGEMDEVEGAELLRRMLERAAAHKDTHGMTGSIQELEDDVAAGRPLTRYR